MAVRQLILENRLGHRVRTFRIEKDEINLIYCKDSHRVEGHADLSILDKNHIEYKVLATVMASKIGAQGHKVKDVGTLRLAGEKDTFSPIYQLAPEQDEATLKNFSKKSAIVHAVVIGLLLLISVFVKTEKPKEEPQLVTILKPQSVQKQVEPKQVVKVAEKKIVSQHTNIKKVAQKTVIKRQPIVKPHAVAHTKTPVRKMTIVRTPKPQNLNNVGALAALGGVKNGTHGSQGLDTNSLKNIRSSGMGAGGGGVGANGAGGMRGVLPGSGLIAGSAGSGGSAQSAGGYGTKGAGGGHAGYGKISLVGNTGGISLPDDEEPTVEGGLDRDQIAAVINKNKGQIIYCYEQALQTSPGLAGRVSVQFVIGTVGKITTAKVAQTSLKSAQVENCIVGKMKTWQFPHPVGKVNVDVLYPFELRRVGLTL